jgi:predicted nucleic acid-binding protein
MKNLLRASKGQTVAVDTMVFIYAFEERPVYLPFLRSFFQEVEKGNLKATTRTITLTECLVQPYRKKDMVLAARYIVLFRNFPHLSVLPVTDEIGERAAILRASYGLKTPDAIQLATALLSASHAFLTNDEGMPEIEGIQVLILDRDLK